MFGEALLLLKLLVAVLADICWMLHVGVAVMVVATSGILVDFSTAFIRTVKDNAIVVGPRGVKVCSHDTSSKTWSKF